MNVLQQQPQQPPPKGLRTHIGLFGRRNVGKSSLLNALVRQRVSIVSEQAGTTTDPVEKPFELQPLGPVQLIDTAGIDDVGALGALRVEKTRQVLDRTDLALLVTEPGGWGAYEQALWEELQRRGVATIVVVNKADIAADPLALRQAQGERTFHPPPGERASHPFGVSLSNPERAPEGVPPHLAVSAKTGAGLDSLRAELLARVPPECLRPPSILGDLVGPGELAVLVVPIDKEAPAGRLILPQVQSIRDLLDSDAMCLVVKERELKVALERLNRPPKLVVTDSQAFLKVAADVPKGVPLTSFSILFARHRGELVKQVEGALAVDGLRSGDRILVAEACGHHPIGEDIGRVKIPRWLTQYTGAQLEFVHFQGHDFPADLASFKLVIHCGACMLNRREVVGRLRRCADAGVPVTNYGVVIAHSLGILDRALEPFPAAVEALRAKRALMAEASA